MIVKIPVFHRHEGIHQGFGRLIQFYQYPVFLQRRVKAADLDRLQPQQGYLLAVIHIFDGFNATAREDDTHMARRFGLVAKMELAGG